MLDREKHQLKVEFKRMKRLYFKEHPKLCAKCDNFCTIIHLHHKTPLEEGGNNAFKNLVPLCDTCCHEWQASGGQPLDRFLNHHN